MYYTDLEIIFEMVIVQIYIKNGMIVSHHAIHNNVGHNLDTLFRSDKMLIDVSRWE